MTYNIMYNAYVVADTHRHCLRSWDSVGIITSHCLVKLIWSILSISNNDNKWIGLPWLKFINLSKYLIDVHVYEKYQNDKKHKCLHSGVHTSVIGPMHRILQAPLALWYEKFRMGLEITLWNYSIHADVYNYEAYLIASGLRTCQPVPWSSCDDSWKDR